MASGPVGTDPVEGASVAGASVGAAFVAVACASGVFWTGVSTAAGGAAALSCISLCLRSSVTGGKA